MYLIDICMYLVTLVASTYYMYCLCSGIWDKINTMLISWYLLNNNINSDVWDVDLTIYCTGSLVSQWINYIEAQPIPEEALRGVWFRGLIQNYQNNSREVLKDSFSLMPDIQVTLQDTSKPALNVVWTSSAVQTKWNLKETVEPLSLVVKSAGKFQIFPLSTTTFHKKFSQKPCKVPVIFSCNVGKHSNKLSCDIATQPEVR